MILLRAGLGGGDFLHGVMKGQAEDFDAKVDGVAGQIALRPAPVGVFDDQSRIVGQQEIARFAGEGWESAFLEQRKQWGQTRGADLLARPPGFREAGGHSLFSNGVE